MDKLRINGTEKLKIIKFSWRDLEWTLNSRKNLNFWEIGYSEI